MSKGYTEQVIENHTVQRQVWHYKTYLEDMVLVLGIVIVQFVSIIGVTESLSILGWPFRGRAEVQWQSSGELFQRWFGVELVLGSGGKHDGDVVNVGGHYQSVEKSFWPIGLEQYENEVVLRVYAEEEAEGHAESRNIVTRYCKTRQEEQEEPQCHVWGSGKKFVDVQISKAKVAEFVADLKLGTSRYEVIMPDLAQAVYETYPQEMSYVASSASDELFFKDYRPLRSIYAWFDLLEQTYSEFVTVETFGTTFEGQKLKGLLINTSKYSEDNPKNKTIIIAAGIHAREWVSISSANYILFQLLTQYGISQPETDYLNQLNIMIVPVFNPDGYVHTWTSDRLWRKNRQETYLPRCFGIDIDHSFSYHWQKTDDTFWPCDEDYSGETPLEALEAAHFNKFLNTTMSKHQHLKIYGYLDLHSYAQEILYPYAFSCDDEPRDKENLLELAYGLSKAIRLSSGKYYEVLAACMDKNVDLSPGLGSGSSLDFMYSTNKMAQWAFQIKLRDSGSHGFLLPAKYIVPVGEEVYQAVKYFFDFILDPEL